MAFLKVVDFAGSTLASNILSTDTSLTVATGDGAKFPTDNFMVIIDNEKILVGTRTGDTFSNLTRGYDGTTAESHLAGAPVELRNFAKNITELQDAVTTLQTSTVPTTRLISTTSPLVGGGDLSANRTLSLAGLTTLGTANYLVGVNSGATAWEYKRLLGTTNQVIVTHGVESITLSLPQNISTTSSPTFAGLTVDTNTLYINNVNHFIGIGTTAPAAKLHIVGNIRIDATLLSEVYVSTLAPAAYLYIEVSGIGYAIPVYNLSGTATI